MMNENQTLTTQQYEKYTPYSVIDDTMFFDRDEYPRPENLKWDYNLIMNLHWGRIDINYLITDDNEKFIYPTLIRIDRAKFPNDIQVDMTNISSLINYFDDGYVPKKTLFDDELDNDIVKSAQTDSLNDVQRAFTKLKDNNLDPNDWKPREQVGEKINDGSKFGNISVKVSTKNGIPYPVDDNDYYLY